MGTTINGNDLTVPGNAEIEALQITGGSPVAGDVLTIDASGNVTFSTPAAVVAGAVVSGSVALASGIGTKVVSGLGLAFIPSRVIPSISKPASGLTIGANVVRSTITADGFTVEFTGLTDATTYFLDWIAFP